MNKQDLVNGAEFTFNNERWCMENESDQIVEAECSFNSRGRFIIWFKGAIVSATKTFKAMENKLNKLKATYNLELSKW